MYRAFLNRAGSQFDEKDRKQRRLRIFFVLEPLSAAYKDENFAGEVGGDVPMTDDTVRLRGFQVFLFVANLFSLFFDHNVVRP